MKYLGIDYGLSKIGLAVADEEIRIAMPQEVIFEDNLDKQLAEILLVLKKESVNAVVIGVPVSRDGKETVQTGKVRDFIAKLRAKIPPSIILYEEDERFTTKMSRHLRQDMARKALSAPDDAVAAACILQGWMDKMGLKR